MCGSCPGWRPVLHLPSRGRFMTPSLTITLSFCRWEKPVLLIAIIHFAAAYAISRERCVSPAILKAGLVDLDLRPLGDSGEAKLLRSRVVKY